MNRPSIRDVSFTQKKEAEVDRASSIGSCYLLLDNEMNDSRTYDEPEWKKRQSKKHSARERERKRKKQNETNFFFLFATEVLNSTSFIYMHRGKERGKQHSH